MRFLRFSAILFLVIGLFSNSALAGGFENTAIGTKARGMGGAFRAIADDWTASYFNPAGLAFILDNQLGADLSLFHNRYVLTPNYRWPGGSNFEQQGIYNGTPINNFHEIHSSPSGGAVVRLPLWGETVFGFSIYQPFDYNLTWNLYKHSPIYNNGQTMPGDEYRNDLDVVAFQVTAAREYTFRGRQLALGLGIQLLRADLLFNDVLFRDNPFQNDPVNKITQWNHNDGYGWGIGFRAGALLKVNEKLDIALTASLPLGIDISGDATLETHLPKTNFNPNTPEYNPGTPHYLFRSGDKVIDSSEFSSRLDLPASIGAGMSYLVNEKLRVALDAELTFWSNYKGLSFEFSNHHGLPASGDTSQITREFLTANVTNPVSWENTIKGMIGLEYQFSQVITLLGGLSYDQSPSRNGVQITPQFVDTGTKRGVSGGVTFHIQQWDLSLVSSLVQQPDVTVESIRDIDNDGSSDNFAGDYQADTYETILSFNYRF